MQWCDGISFKGLQCSVGKAVSPSETRPAALSDHAVVPKHYRKPCKGNSWSPRLTAILSMQGMNASIKIVVLESLAGIRPSLQPLPDESLVGIGLNHGGGGGYRKRCKKSEDTL